MVVRIAIATDPTEGLVARLLTTGIAVVRPKAGPGLMLAGEVAYQHGSGLPFAIILDGEWHKVHPGLVQELVGDGLLKRVGQDHDAPEGIQPLGTPDGPPRPLPTIGSVPPVVEIDLGSSILPPPVCLHELR